MSSAGIQYVQPVQVVPVGQPIPAVHSSSYQYTVPVEKVDHIDRDYQVSSFNAPTHSFGPPASISSSSSYNPTGSSYSNPITNYKGPKAIQQSSYGSSISKIDSLELYQTNFNTVQAEEQVRPVRSGRRDECYCVPVAQCPADKILGSTPNKDYSSLINPRVKNPNIDITAPAGRSALEDIVEEEEEEEEEEAVTEAVTELAEETTITEVSRKRRQNDDIEPIFEKSRLSNEFTLETSTIPAASRLATEDLNLSEEEQKLLEKIKEKKKELRKKERKEKLKKKDQLNVGADEEGTFDNSDIEDLASEDKSFDSLASLTGDISNKVGAAGDNVKSGVSVSFIND